MKENKLAKAYWTAWRWPEVYSDDLWVIWVSRIIAIVLPLSLVGLTLITATPLFGLSMAILIAAVLALIIVLVTIRLFYTEYPSVESFDAREARVKEFFTGFPKQTSIPLIELERDEWVAYGHIPPKEFTTAISEVILYAGEDHNRSNAFSAMTLEDSVGHLYAKFRNPEENHWSEGIELCKKTTEGSFPITRLQL